jgi:tetratricopeptide (TPR) repeat protein
MRKLVLLLVCLCAGGVVSSSNAQVNRLQARDAEWKSYSVPQTNFARQTSPEKDFVFRVPADWKQEGTNLTFSGPHSATLQVFVQKVADGYPLQDYFGMILQSVKDTPGAAAATLTRKTQLQDLEAREIVVEMPDVEGEVIRSTSWITIKGPLAVMFNLQVPAPHAAEIEPFFKAVVQSVIFVAHDYRAFELLRAAIKSPAPGPINTIESIVASLNEVNGDRASAITQLTSLFTSHPDVSIDLLLDRRPFVRAAAVQALARSNNTALTPFLWEMIDDSEALVAEAAARAVASTPDVVAKTIKHSSFGFKTETIARIWAFMSREKRNELLTLIFSKTAVGRTSPPVVKPAAKNKVTVSIAEMVAIKPGNPIPEVGVNVSNDPNVQIGALTLLSTISPQEFKLPLERIMASKFDPLIAVGLQVADYRREMLPVEPLLKLVTSSDSQVSRLAARCLGWSANVPDIPRLEALISKDSATAKKALDDELKLSVKKIRFRHELKGAKSATESREIIRKTFSDSSLADFAIRYHCELTVAGCAPASTQTALKPDFAVKPFAENLFPKKLRHFTAIPNPGQAIEKLYQTLHGLQMESPRAQSNLILTMGYLRQSVAQQLSAPVDAATLIEYTGIDPNSPIVFGTWTAEGAPDSSTIAQRRAIVLRVKDRERFERTIEQFQKATGSFTNLTDRVAITTRAIAALPAFLPLVAQAVLSRDSDTTRPDKGPNTYIVANPLLSYAFVADKEWNGLHIKTIEHLWIKHGWQIEDAATHMVFIGDTVILTSDLAAIRDLLGNVNNQTDRQYLADNPEFRKAIGSRGDVVYFSDLKSVMSEVSEAATQVGSEIKESGALNIGSATWENSHRLVFEESDWAKPLLPFHPKELSAPRDLLPARTIAYYLMKVDLANFWSSKLKTVFGDDLKTTANVWSLDFKQEVLPELGPECGAIVLELPNLEFDGGTWAAFCKLKSNKLADALSTGKLFSGVGPTKDFAEVKVGTDSYFVGTRNGFLVVSNHGKGLAAFDGKSNLAATRDYSKAAERVPNGIVAFGGYNIEAAIAAANNKTVEGPIAHVADIIFSVASAFHSQSFFATASAGTVDAQSSVATDREGRYSVADFSFLPRASNITFVSVEPTGVPIRDQKRLSSLVVKLRAKAAGPIDNIKDDLKTAEQTIEQKSAKELLLTVAARRGGGEKAIELPVKAPEFAEFLKATSEFAVNDQSVKKQASEIAGQDRDAWSVARKLADWTHKNLEWKSVATANAAQTLATREADCSEFSALFVAMARSLGLPARMVTGLAYSGTSFGGHAWVEVWVGKWIELDPTWGTHFVDATHIRGASNALVMASGLNLIELEVMETRRTVADFQKSPTALMQHLIKAIPAGDKSDIEAALDVETLTDEFMGAGAWSKMNEAEREQMWSAYGTVLNEIVTGYGKGSYWKMRLLHLEEKGNVAEASCLLGPIMLLKLRLVRRNDLWHLVEIAQTDTNLYSASEAFRPAIATIEKARAGQKASPAGLTDFVRVVLLLQSDATKAIAVADRALKVKPADQGLRLLKAMALMRLEKGDEAAKLLRELSDENFAPAVNKLANFLHSSEDESKKKEALSIYERYTSLEPHDSRGFADLAEAYSEAKELGKAEAAYRKVIELNPAESYGYLNLIHFLIVNDRVGEVAPVLVAGDKHKDTDEDLFGSAMENLHMYEAPENAAIFAASDPLRMKTSYQANLSLGHMYQEEKSYADALRYFEISAQLDKTSTEPHVSMSVVYRKQSRWSAALKAAQRAISLDNEDSEAYYQLACALTRLGRTKEALSALATAVEFDPDQVEYMVKENDLKALASLPAFKKLIPEPVKQ